MSDDDQTQRVQTPSGLRQRIHHLLTVAFDRRQFVVTDVRVHRLQRFQTRQLRRQLSSASLRAASISPCAAGDLRFTLLQNRMNVLLHRIDQLATGMAVDRAQLAVEAFELHLRGEVVAVLSSSMRTGSPAGSG